MLRIAQMKNIIKAASVSLLVMFFTSDSKKLYAQPIIKDYELVFRAEFNDPEKSRPDTAVWSIPERRPYLWARQISASPATAFIKRGRLVCRAIPNISEKNDTAAMLTSAFCTKGKFEFQYGKVEVRMRTNSDEGNFPAAWLVPADGGGNPYRYGEIDIFETFGDDGIAHQTVHNHRTFALGKKEDNIFPHHIDVTKWHVYGVEWTPDYIMFSIDGETTGYFEKSTDPELLAEGQWTFDRPFYIIINQSTGQKGWHEPDETATYETEFDWVRVYQKRK